MARDARIWRGTAPIHRDGNWVFTFVEFYGVYTTASSELRAYNAAGQRILSCFTDSDSIQHTTSSAVLMPSGWVYRQIGVHWLFRDANLAAQAVSFHIWLWADFTIIDYY